MVRTGHERFLKSRPLAAGRVKCFCSVTLNFLNMASDFP
jgi:hypothetical protein